MADNDSISRLAVSSSYLNPLSQKILGYDILVRSEEGELKIEATNRALFVVATLIQFTLAYSLLTFLLKGFFQNNNLKRRKDQMIWKMALCKGAFGFIGSMLCLYERYIDKELSKHITKSKTELSYILVLTCLGWFSFEWLHLTIVNIRYKCFNLDMHAHHALGFFGFLSTVSSDMGHYTACSGFIIEYIAPFSCINFCLSKLNKRDNLAWKINLMILIHAYHLRSIIEFSLMYEYIYYFHEFKQLSLMWNITLPGGIILIGLYLTPLWTYQYTEGLFKTLFEFKAQKSDKDKKS